MTPSIYQAANAYSSVNIATDIASASPHKLILMLLEGLMSFIWAAKNHLEKGNISGKVESLSKAMDILDELNASINHEVGGDIAGNLSRLYDYCVRRLVHANVNNQIEPLNEVESLISGLRDTWNEIRDQALPPVREEGGVRGNP